MTKNPVVDDRVWRAIRARVAEVGKRKVAVGFFAGAGTEARGENIAGIAAIHEFGAPKAHIPARPFFRSAFTGDGGNALRAFTERLARAVVSERVDVPQALGLLGAWAASAIKRRIRSNIPPPLALATIKRKGSSKTLIDTGRMLNSVTWVVTE